MHLLNNLFVTKENERFKNIVEIQPNNLTMTNRLCHSGGLKTSFDLSLCCVKVVCNTM